MRANGAWDLMVLRMLLELWGLIVLIKLMVPRVNGS